MVMEFVLSNRGKDKQRKAILRQVLLVLGLSAMCPAAVVYGAVAGDSGVNPNVLQQEFNANQAGAQLAQIKQWEMKAKGNALLNQGRQTSEAIQNNNQAIENHGSAELHFTLKEVDFSQSKVFNAEELQSLVAPYKGKSVDLNTLYEIVNAINQKYHDGGYLTCQAYLPPQRIRDGIVHIALSEGVNGTVTIKGNKHTRTKYITDRIHLKPGEIPRLPDMNASVLRFNATNDAQLRIALEPGKVQGTTDYVLTLMEPKRSTVGLIVDTAGNDSSGKIRTGLYWNYRSLTGVRDTMSLTALKTKGNKNYSFSYSRPVSKNGMTVNLNVAANTIRITKGPLERLHMHGKGHSISLGFTRPLTTTEKSKSDWGLTIATQKSENDVTGNTKWTEDTSRSADFFYDRVRYGNKHSFYERYDLEFGSTRMYKGVNSNGEEYITKSYSKLLGYLLYQKMLGHGRMLNYTFSWQYSPKKYLPSGEQFYLGGMYSVRGYTDNVISGDGGAYGRVEYSIPLHSKHPTYMYTFLDMGQVWGKSAFDSKRIASVGLGFKSNIGTHHSFNLGIGVPLIKTLNGVVQPKKNIIFSYNGTF